MPKRGQKWALLEAISRRFQAVSDTIEGSPLFRKMDTFRPPIAPSALHMRETDGGTTDRVIDAFAPFEGLVLRYIEDDRSSCAIGVLPAFDGL